MKVMIATVCAMVIVMAVVVLVVPWVAFAIEDLWPRWLSVWEYFGWCVRKQAEIKKRRAREKVGENARREMLDFLDKQ